MKSHSHLQHIFYNIIYTTSNIMQLSRRHFWTCRNVSNVGINTETDRKMMTTVFWNVILYHLISGYWHLGEMSCVQINCKTEGEKILTILLAPIGSLRAPNTPVPLPIPVPFFSLYYPKDGGGKFLQKSVNICQATGCWTEDSNFIVMHTRC